MFRPLATKIQTSSGDRKIPVITQKGEASWMEEEEAYSLSDDSFGQIALSAYKVGTAIKISEELLNDSVFDLPSYIAKEFARRIGSKEEEAFLIGDGKGKPTGIFTNAGGAENGATTSTANISFDDMIELFYSVKSPYRKKAVWILNEQTVKALRKLKDNTGNYIWQPAVSSGLPDTILNRPYVTSVYAPVSAAGAKPIAFGDLSYYWIADRQGRKLKDNTGNYIWSPSVQAGVPDTILNRPYKTSSYVPEIKAGNKCMAFGDFSYYWVADRQGRSFKRLNELFAMNGQVGFLASQRVDGKLILPEAIKTLTIKKA